MNNPLPAALTMVCLLMPVPGWAQNITLDEMRQTCVQDPYPCVLGAHVLSLIAPCETLPKQAAGQPADFTMAVRLRLQDGKPLSVRISSPSPEPTPFEQQMAAAYRDAVMNCQPYGPVSSTAIFWIEIKVEEAP